MKNLSIATTAFLLTSTFVFAPSAFAEDSTVSATRPRIEAREEIHDLRMENRALIASREAEFKVNLQKIRDARKQTIVSNISDRISNRNTVWISHWNIVTKRLSAILDKIQTRSDEAAAKGTDVSSVTTAISAGRTSIANAQTAINAQQGKVYTISITSEGNLGTDVSSTISTFHKDVTTVITLLNAARKAVESAFSALRTAIGTTTQP